MRSSSTTPAKAGSGACVVVSIDAQVTALLGQNPPVRAAAPKGRRRPPADVEVMVQVRRIEVRHISKRIDGGAALGRQG